MPKDIILNHLESYSQTATIKYLEYLIQVRQEISPDFHDKLILYYLDRLVSLPQWRDWELRQRNNHDSFVAVGEEPGILGVYRKCLFEILENSACYRADRLLRKFPRNSIPSSCFPLF